jgi:hypothetical protein
VNDYLTNLATRSLKLTPALEPRSQSRFEPPAPGGVRPRATAPGESALDAKTEEVESAAPAASPGAAGRRASGPLALAERKSESIAPPPRETSTSQSSGKAGSSPDSSTGRSVHPQETIRRPEPTSRFLPAIHATADRGGAIGRPLPNTVESMKAEAAVRPETQQNGEESPRSPLELRTRSLIDEQVVIKEILRQGESERVVAGAPAAEIGSPAREPERPATSSPIVAQPRVTPLFEDRRGDRAGRGDERAAPPSPTIHVTIGRVEVRATQPASPSSPKQRQARPAMSLDDYLRGRGNGGAR